MTEVERLQKLHGEISALRDDEATFAIGYSQRLDAISHLLKPHDQRFAILDLTKGRLDGLRIALDKIEQYIAELAQS